jgi:ubiquinone/menaquinone biosynthesis C-methylase UbiE
MALSSNTKLGAALVAQRLAEASFDLEARSDRPHETRFNTAPFRELLEKRRGGANRLLDLGCGTGALGPIAASIGWDYTGIDLSRGMLEIAERNASPGIRYVRASMRELPFPGESFRLCLCIAAIYFLPKQTVKEEVLPEIRRVLARGGTAELVALNGDGDGLKPRRGETVWLSEFQPNEFEEAASAAGLETLYRVTAAQYTQYALRRS